MVETGQKPTKVCWTCGEVKPVTLFYCKKENRDGREHHCKACRLDRQRVIRVRPVSKVMKYGYRILREYGLTWEMHEELILRARGHCESCGEPFTNANRSIHIDHCHTTKDVRGLLCGGCNKSAGYLMDCPDRIFSLIKYIMETRYDPFLKSEDLHLSKKTT